MVAAGGKAVGTSKYHQAATVRHMRAQCFERVGLKGFGRDVGNHDGFELREIDIAERARRHFPNLKVRSTQHRPDLRRFTDGEHPTGLDHTHECLGNVVGEARVGILEQLSSQSVESG